MHGYASQLSRCSWYAPVQNVLLSLDARILRQCAAYSKQSNSIFHELDFLDLREIEYHRGFTTEERNEHRDFVPLGINIYNCTNIFGKRTIKDTYLLPFGKLDTSLWRIRLLNDRFKVWLHLIFQRIPAFKTETCILDSGQRSTAIWAGTRQRSAAIGAMLPTRQSFFFTGRTSFFGGS